MKASEVWVVYNRCTAEILFVYPEEYMAIRKKNFLHENTVSGSIPNKDKILHLTLDRAVHEINLYNLNGVS